VHSVVPLNEDKFSTDLRFKFGLKNKKEKRIKEKERKAYLGRGAIFGPFTHSTRACFPVVVGRAHTSVGVPQRSGVSLVANGPTA
jgi:hypothetical protein